MKFADFEEMRNRSAKTNRKTTNDADLGQRARGFFKS